MSAPGGHDAHSFDICAALWTRAGLPSSVRATVIGAGEREAKLRDPLFAPAYSMSPRRALQ